MTESRSGENARLNLSSIVAACANAGNQPHAKMRLAGAIELLMLAAIGVVMPGMEVAFVDD